MKSVNKIWILGTVLAGMFCQAVLADDELTEKQKAAYRQVVKQAEDRYGSYTLRNDENIQYAEGVCYLELKDMNQDGISELLIVHNSGEKTEYGYRKPESYQYDLWTYRDEKAEFLETDILRYSNGGWPSVCWTEYGGKTYLVSNCHDAMGEEFHGFLEDGTFGVAEQIYWEYEGAENGYLNDEEISMDSLREEQQYRMENAYGTGLYYENGDQGAQIVNRVKKQLNFADSTQSETTDVKMETVVEGHDGYGIIRGYDEEGNITWQVITAKFPMTEFTPVKEIGIFQGFYYYEESGTVVKLNLSDGSVVWKNTDGAGNAVASVFGEDGKLYVCGSYGPDFMEIDADGITLKRIEHFSTTDYWPYQMIYTTEYVDVLMENCVSGSGYRVYLDDYDYWLLESPGGSNEVQDTGYSEFYGIWCYGSRGWEDAENYAETMRQNGYDAQVFLTTDWSNLNTDPYWVVTAGQYASEEAAYQALPSVQKWCADAYVKYSGNWQG